MGKGDSIIIYRDSCSTLTIIHVHGIIYKERGLLTAGGKDNNNKEGILALLEATWLPLWLSSFYCQGHQNDDYPQVRCNQATDLAAH